MPNNQTIECRLDTIYTNADNLQLLTSDRISSWSAEERASQPSTSSPDSIRAVAARCLENTYKTKQQSTSFKLYILSYHKQRVPGNFYEVNLSLITKT